MIASPASTNFQTVSIKEIGCCSLMHHHHYPQHPDQNLVSFSSQIQRTQQPGVHTFTHKYIHVKLWFRYLEKAADAQIHSRIPFQSIRHKLFVQNSQHMHFTYVHVNLKAKEKIFDHKLVSTTPTQNIRTKSTIIFTSERPRRCKWTLRPTSFEFHKIICHNMKIKWNYERI